MAHECPECGELCFCGTRDELACVICEDKRCEGPQDATTCQAELDAADRVLSHLFSASQLAALEDGSGEVTVKRKEAEMPAISWSDARYNAGYSVALLDILNAGFVQEVR